MAFIFFFLMPNFPEEAKWLTDEERSFVKARIRADQGRVAAERSISLRDVGNVFKDFKVYLGGLMVSTQPLDQHFRGGLADESTVFRRNRACVRICKCSPSSSMRLG